MVAHLPTAAKRFFCFCVLRRISDPHVTGIDYEATLPRSGGVSGRLLTALPEIAKPLAEVVLHERESFPKGRPNDRYSPAQRRFAQTFRQTRHRP